MKNSFVVGVSANSQAYTSLTFRIHSILKRSTSILKTNTTLNFISKKEKVFPSKACISSQFTQQIIKLLMAKMPECKFIILYFLIIKIKIMFDDILNLVKEHLGNHPALADIPAEQQDAIHNEIANHIANSAATDQGTTVSAEPAKEESLFGGLVEKLESAVAGGGTTVSAIEGGLVGSLVSKFGLPPSIAGAVSGALPGLLQKFAAKQNTAGN